MDWKDDRSAARRAAAGLARTALGPSSASRLGDRAEDGTRLISYLSSTRGRESARRLYGMRNRHWGQRAWIIGNGPSLRKMDLSPLANEYTFGANRIYLAFDEFGFHTTYLSASARWIIRQFGREMSQSGPQVFMSHFYAKQHPELPSTVTTFLSRRRECFGRDPLFWGFSDGGTVTYTSMQLAFYFGFTEVILIGVDHSFVETGTAAAEVVPQAPDDPRPATVVSGGDDPNHFLPNYFGKGVKWTLPSWQQMETAYAMARDAYGAAGRKIVDATVDGKLTIFPKVKYEDVLSARVI
ncbi:MAG TPA: hypothetical protein VL979_13725 [Solirubrobacteraceae bacterium]|nr:hypothetical protein [Solirubrobacteraceae bacterium]